MAWGHLGVEVPDDPLSLFCALPARSAVRQLSLTDITTRIAALEAAQPTRGIPMNHESIYDALRSLPANNAVQDLTAVLEDVLARLAALEAHANTPVTPVQ